MLYNPDNPVVQLCVKGIQKEYAGNFDQAAKLYREAWDLAADAFESFTAAHYMARIQNSVYDTLKWNLFAYQLATQVVQPDISEAFPSLCLNVAKSYEDVKQYPAAEEYYQLAERYSRHLKKDQYGNMIISGVKAGIERVKAVTSA
ncbi:rRNA adenine methyltransferase [Foetidibacter luteolus]|uniref:rRNA adenine methyltransferase n=1 Tax=Foetidibacter luteolus TaxID=2608880 RepID=UPI00129A338B|nr:rRNA adenine methyltransferase [Foetidibacter luteolus]